MIIILSIAILLRRYDDELENTWGCGSWCEYLLTVILSTVLLIAASVLTLFWVINYQGGFAWSENPKLQFNLHPVLMVGGFVTLSGFCKYQRCRHSRPIRRRFDGRRHLLYHIARGWVNKRKQHIRVRSERKVCHVIICKKRWWLPLNPWKNSHDSHTQYFVSPINNNVFISFVSLVISSDPVVSTVSMPQAHLR